MKRNIIIVVLVIIFNCILLNTCLQDADELWVYANIYKLANGYQMYQDLNIIQTPIFFVLGAIVLNVFGKNFLIFRIYGILLNSCFILMIYLLLKTCNIGKRTTLLYIIMICGMTIEILQTGASYNILVFILVLLGIILEIKYRLLRGNKWWIQTVLSMLIFLTKQNVGMYYFIGICTLELMWNKNLIRVLKQGLLFALMLGGFLILLEQIGILDGFISYTVLGLKEFKEKNLAMNVILIGINIVLPIISSILYFYLKMKKNVRDDVLDILYIIGIAMLLFAYPLFNWYHVLLSTIIILIFAIYIVEQILFKDSIDDKKYDKFLGFVIWILIVPIILYSGLSIYSWLIHREDDKWDNPYFGAIFDEETKSEIEVMTKYIKEKETEGIKVYVFSNKASLYNIPLGICNGAMDLPMTGNFGRDGEEGMIETIKSLRNGEILVDKEYESDYQKPLKVREWIENNLEKQGEIEKFVIYNLGNE